MIIAVPALTPVTTPEPDTTVATNGSLLPQVPPALASLSVVDDPTHTEDTPVIAAGSGFTVKIAEMLQPVDSL